MTLNLCVLTPNRIVWDSEVKEIILSTNSGQIGILPNHAPIATAVDIGVLRIRLKDQWLTMALMGGFARIGNNEITILVNDADRAKPDPYPDKVKPDRVRVDPPDFRVRFRVLQYPTQPAHVAALCGDDHVVMYHTVITSA